MNYDICNIANRDAADGLLEFFYAKVSKNFHILPEAVPKSSTHIQVCHNYTLIPGTNFLI